MGKHGAVILRRVDKPAPSTVASASSRALSHAEQQTASTTTTTTSSPNTPNKGLGGSPMPVNWSLWQPGNGIVFGGASSASATVTASTTAIVSTATTTTTRTTQTTASSVQSTPRTFVPRTAASPLAQPSPRPAVAFAQQQTTHFVHTTMPIRFSPRRPIHSMAQAAVYTQEEKPTKETIVNTKENKEEETRENNETKVAEKAKAEEPPAEVLPPETTLDYKVPDDLFRAARDAPEGTPESYWTYALYRQVQAKKKEEEDEHVDEKSDDKAGDKADDKSSDDAVTFTAEGVKVHYCKSKMTTERVCKEYFLGEPLLGFDLEWMANATRYDGARRNVCLVQLASPSRIGLFHLSLYPAKDDLMAPTLKKILEDANSIKAGVFIKGDATRLRKFLKVDMHGMIELSHLHKLVTHSKTGETKLINKKLVSLAVQVQEHLRLPMFKGQDVRSGDWSRSLSMDQILYSASDAYAAVQIFSVLEKRREALDPKPPRPAFVELNLPIKLADGVVASASAVEEAGDEAAEEAIEDDASGGTSAELSPEFLERAKKTIEFEAEDDGDAAPATPAKGRTGSASSASASKTPKTPKTPATPKTPRTPKSQATPAKAKDPRIVAAEEWLARFKATAVGNGRTVRAKPASLRAYHLWHSNDDLDPVTLAALLRDPPLQTNTVVTYILEAVQLESLPYLKTRLRDEVLDKVPREFSRKYSGLMRATGYASGTGSAGGAGNAASPAATSSPRTT
ncbi:hypothetical protein Sste5346_005660 [Sporothrix stenoceras]|uniref:3'-5' exonuclease domain-containing protein n=1 Tax=Sporothrix stenoceras TaxID=5173 RepID=A0ABR3Z4G5_9PEZI